MRQKLTVTFVQALEITFEFDLNKPKDEVLRIVANDLAARATQALVEADVEAINLPNIDNVELNLLDESIANDEFEPVESDDDE